MGVAELGAEELVGREAGAGSGAVQDRGKRAVVDGGHGKVAHTPAIILFIVGV